MSVLSLSTSLNTPYVKVNWKLFSHRGILSVVLDFIIKALILSLISLIKRGLNNCDYGWVTQTLNYLLENKGIISELWTKQVKREIIKCHWRQIKLGCLCELFNTVFFVMTEQRPTKKAILIKRRALSCCWKVVILGWKQAQNK